MEVLSASMESPLHWIAVPAIPEPGMGLKVQQGPALVSETVRTKRLGQRLWGGQVGTGQSVHQLVLSLVLESVKD